MVRTAPAEYTVTRVLATNTTGTETTRVPGLRFTLAEIQDIIDHRVWGDVLDAVNMFCAECGESVVDCPEIGPSLIRVPQEWSWEAQLDH